jgi:Zn ribbon nucleic-acid-binding protein
LCIAEQRIIHVPWHWCLACLVRCEVHGASLLDSCPACGEPDPLSFTAPDLPQIRVCCSCGGELTHPARADANNQNQQSIQIVQDAYRATLLRAAPHPSLLGKITDHAFRKFVDDILQVLIAWIDPRAIQYDVASDQTSVSSRHDALRVITELISNAAPNSNPPQRRAAYARDLKLWGALFTHIPASASASLEEASVGWPLPLRRRFSAAIHHQRRKSWPRHPFRHNAFRPRFKCLHVPKVLDLTA